MHDPPVVPDHGQTMFQTMHDAAMVQHERERDVEVHVPLAKAL
jgi:hypothetical protein